jgi:hypothetical protein
VTLMARSASSRHCSMVPAIEVEADGRRMQPAPPCLTSHARRRMLAVLPAVTPFRDPIPLRPDVLCFEPHGVILSLGEDT